MINQALMFTSLWSIIATEVWPIVLQFAKQTLWLCVVLVLIQVWDLANVSLMKLVMSLVRYLLPHQIMLLVSDVFNDIGIRHDTDIGCGQGSDKGHMSGHHRGWSTCSRREFEANYLNLRRRNNWCLKPGK